MLKVEKLIYSINNRNILNDITIDLEAGQSLCLFGKNGSGKSSLLKCISGINPIDEGTVKISGEQSHDRLPFYSSLGCFFNENGFYHYLTIEENYKVFLTYYKMEKQEIYKAIKEYAGAFELNDLLNKKIKHLSAGQKQRASLALTYMHQPKLLLFDEPLNNLDAYFIDLFYSITRSYIEENTAATIIVNHDILSTPDWVNKIALIENARLIMTNNTQTNIEAVYKSIIQK